MRLALLYPPPWKLAAPGEPRPAADGPPAEYRDGDLDADFYQTPYGLFQLGAEAERAGVPAKVLNLSAFPWVEVEAVIRRLDADVFGLSCWTSNRRGVALTAAAIKRAHPGALVLVGGPHATPLARQLLEHHPDIDLVCRGESDHTLLEILERRRRGEALVGIAGTAYRVDGRVELAPDRPAVADLDTLAHPHARFATHIVMTSRGCAWACTFCGAETTWGRGFRAQSVDYVLDELALALERLPVRMVQIKDDTFTTNKKRVLALCRGIRQRGLNFLWSCDTRVDVLSDELLREMRLAGCERLSLGVESGSQTILDAIDKKITPQEILDSAALARKYGIRVRFYMMLGNRGETRATFEETLRFLERAAPDEYLFSCLSIYPGTRDWFEAERRGLVDARMFFEGDFQELKVPFDASAEDTALMNAWFAGHSGLQRGYQPTRADAEGVVALLPEHAPAWLDLAGACLREGDLGAARAHADRALELGHPCPGLCLDLLAVAAHREGELERMKELFLRAARVDPQHWSLIRNVNAARAWFQADGPARALPLELHAEHDFQLLERTLQPTLPGPLPEGWERWDTPAASADRGPAGGLGDPAAPGAGGAEYLTTPDRAGSRAPLRRLPTVTR